MHVFFDTEFTTIEKDGFRTLISIGCVAQDGREFMPSFLMRGIQRIAVSSSWQRCCRYYRVASAA